jgi:REP element-mobilizing transposase RayT
MSDQDREKFLELLSRAVEQFHLRVHGYVLMDNHYHLLIETPHGGLNRALRYLNGVYTQTFNRRHKRVGHLFQGRYKAILVEKESYLLELSRYVHLNPWRVRESQDPFEYRWSSLGVYAGKVVRPPWLTITEVLAYFGNKGKRGYQAFIGEGMKRGLKTPWEEVRGQVVIGTEEFVEEVAKTHLRSKKHKRGEESGLHQLVAVKPDFVVKTVTKYFGITGKEIRRREQRYTDARYVVSYLLRRYCLLTLREVGERVGLHYSAVGNAIRQVRERPTSTQVKSLRDVEDKFKNL